jgi:hypothetical protein
MAGRGRDPGRSVTSRVLAVLAAFDDGHPRLRLSEVARRSGLPVSTVSRLLAELVAVVSRMGSRRPWSARAAGTPGPRRTREMS